MSHKFTDQSNRHPPNITPKFKLFFIMSILYTCESSHIIQQFGIHSSRTPTHSTQRTTDKALKFFIQTRIFLGTTRYNCTTTVVVLGHGSSTQYCSTTGITKYFHLPDARTHIHSTVLTTTNTALILTTGSTSHLSLENRNDFCSRLHFLSCEICASMTVWHFVVALQSCCWRFPLCRAFSCRSRVSSVHSGHHRIDNTNSNKTIQHYPSVTSNLLSHFLCPAAAATTAQNWNKQQSSVECTCTTLPPTPPIARNKHTHTHSNSLLLYGQSILRTTTKQ